MTGRLGPITLVLTLLTLLAVPASSPRADRLHLASGGHVDVGRWWAEGDWIYYDGPGGVVGLPRSVVTRIDSAETSRGSGGDSSVAPAPPGGAGKKTPQREVRRVPAELAPRIQAGYDALRSRELEAASRSFWDVLRDHPDVVAAQVGYALAEIALERDGMALRVVLDGLARDPRQPELLELLGDLRDREERVEEALRQWRAAAEVAPTERLREKIARAEREIAAGRDYDFAATSHFNVRYDGDVDRALAGEVMDYLEEQYVELSSRFRHGPAQPITVVLYPTREFRDVTRSPDWVGGIYDGKIRVPLAGLSRLHPAAEAVLRHELAHAFIHSKTRGHCPRWLHEGLAQVVEGRNLLEAQRGELASHGVPPDGLVDPHAKFSYPAALGLTRFLEARRGLHGVIWVLDLLGRGTDLDEALRQTYGLEYEGLVRQWNEELRQESP